MASSTNPTRTAALDRMTRALEAAKQARDRGTNVQWVRMTLKEARSAFEAGNYALAMERADDILSRLGVSPEAPPAFMIPAASLPPAGGVPASTELGAAAGRLAEATEAVKQAKKHGFDVQAAKAALRQAKQAFKERDYRATIQFASQAMELSGSTGRVRP